MRDGFVQASYLELTGNEYINTYFKPNNNSKVVIDCQVTDATFASYTAIFGARNNNSNQFWIFTDKTTDTETWTARWYGTGYNLAASFTDRHLIILESSKFTIDDNSVTISSTSTFTSSYYLYIGNVNNAGNGQYPSKVKIYSCKIYNNGTLVRDLVPCSEESSGHIGLYDNINDIFYRPFGTGNSVLKIEKPIIGSININGAYKTINNGYVNINGSYKPISQAYMFKDEEYTKLDYIQSNGIQKIDTGIKPSDDLVTTVDFQCLSDGIVDNCIFGSSWTINGYLFNAYQSGGGLRWHYGGVQKDVNIDATTRITASCSKSGITVNGTKYTFTPTGTNSTNNIYIFSTPDVESIRGAGTETNYNGRFKLYSFKMVKNGVTLRNYIPVKRKSDNMIGLYETIENKFYCSDSSIKDKIPYSKRSCIETTYANSDHNTNAKWVYNNTSNYAANAKVFMAPDGELNGVAEILEAFGASDAYKFAKYNYDYGYAEPHTNLKSSDCTLVSIKVTNSSGTEISSSYPVMFVDDNHRMHFAIASTALASAAAGNYTLTITVSRSSVSCKFDIPITKIDTASRYFIAGNSSSNISKNSLVKMCDIRTITCKSFTAELLVPTWTITSKVSGASYGFSKTSDGYYTSSNAGVANSASVCRVKFTNNTGAAYTVTFNCINYAESTYDYGIIGKINTALSTSYIADSTYTKSFSGSQSSSIQTVKLSVPTGTSWVDVKYRKDNSVNRNNDSLKFKITT